MTRPVVVGLTGSIGMGKSTVAEMFARAGVPVFDADAEVRKMQGVGGELLEAIEAAFPGTTGPDGLDRDAVGRQVFANSQALARLEAIVHPAVARRREAFLIEHIGAPLVVFDIPLLFERGGHRLVDEVVVVSAPPEVQRRRVLARAGMTEEKFARILSLQVPDADKRSQADHVIDTGTTLGQTEAQVRALIPVLAASRHGATDAKK